MKLEPTILEGGIVRLEPLEETHLQGLCDAIRNGALWTSHVTKIPQPDNIDRFFDAAKKHHTNGEGIVFATIEKSTSTVVGSTRFLNTDIPAGRTEIGFTFLGKQWQKTRINTEAKLLMLAHAFDYLKLNRVAFLTDYLNDQSRRAILGLGAKQEGVLRNHIVMPSGRVRDSVIFSIIKNEWPGVKEHLLWKLAQ